MKKRFSLYFAILFCIGILAGCASEQEPIPSGNNSIGSGSQASRPPQSAAGVSGQPGEASGEASTVYMTLISPRKD